MLICLQRQFSSGMNNMNSQMADLTRDFSDFKYEILISKKKSLRKVILKCVVNYLPLLFMPVLDFLGPRGTSSLVTVNIVSTRNIHRGRTGRRNWYVHTILPGNSTEIAVFYRLLVWKGREDKVWVKGIKQKDLRAVDCQLRVKDLCRKLVELLFTDDDLRTGNATEARTTGVKLLDSHKVYAIRGKITGIIIHHPCMISTLFFYCCTVHCLYRFPEEGGLNSMAEKQTWKKLKQSVMNVMCREARSKKKL
jgi:hypothetical protein